MRAISGWFVALSVVAALGCGDDDDSEAIGGTGGSGVGTGTDEGADEGPCYDKPDGTDCDDDLGCTVNDVCQSGSCVGTVELDCSDESELAVKGTLDGETIEICMDVGGGWRQGNPDNRLELSRFGRGYTVLRVEWENTLRPGETGAARGYLDLSNSGGPNFGNCEADGYVSEITASDGEQPVTFILRQLRKAPYCEGATVTGELLGCWH